MPTIASALRTLAGALLFAGAANAAAVQDIVLHLPDIRGESRLKDYLHWIDIDDFHWGVTNAATGKVGTGGIPVYDGLTVTKRVDAASPRLALSCGQGDLFPSARLEFTSALPGAPRFHVIELAEVAVRSIQSSSPPGSDAPVEEVAFTFRGIEEIHTELSPKGQPSPDVSWWWNLLKGLGGDAAVECITASPDHLRGPAASIVDARIFVPPMLNISGTIGVTAVSSDPSIVSFPGAANGRTLIALPGGSPPSATFPISLLRPGRATITLSRPGVCTANSILVEVGGALVRNPSFEQNYPEGWPHYGAIENWSGGTTSGVNTVEGPFQDNGWIPDRGQVAFLQGSGALVQEISGLEAGRTHWLQFASNARSCCGGSLRLEVLFDGATIAHVDAVTPVGAGQPYHWASIPFVPATAHGPLTFVGTATGDATLLLDAVSLVRREPDSVVLRNPSFEASGIPAAPGYLAGTQLDGWEGTGNFGINASEAGPFADNGVAPDQSAVVFLQQAHASIQQELSGLVPGAPYTLSFAANARSGNEPKLKVTFADSVLFSGPVTPAGLGKPYRLITATFRPAAARGTLRFEQTRVDGDHTVLLDDVILTPGTLAPAAAALGVRVVAPGQLRVGWPMSPYGFKLQRASALAGPWADAEASVILEGEENVIYESTGSGAQFFRLVQ